MFRLRVLVAMCLLVHVVGCGGAPSIEAPKFNAKKIAAGAMELYDVDADGFLTQEELAASPGLRDGTRTIDQDDDQKLTADEIVARMEGLIASKNGSQNSSCQFKHANGQPVVGAKITFEPEAFLDDVIVPGTGKTNSRGEAELTCSATPFGIQPGFYRIRVSKVEGSQETIPAEFNSASTLGAEVSGLTRGDELGCYVFTLE